MGYEQVTGKTPDISEFLDFSFYDLVWYHPGVHPSISEDNRVLGRWLGVSHRNGSNMCYWVMGRDVIPVTETTIQHVTFNNMLDVNIASQIEQFDEALQARLDDSNFKLPGMDDFAFNDINHNAPSWEHSYGDNITANFEPLVNAEDDIDPAVYNKYIGAKMILDNKANGGSNIATVKRQVTDVNGRPIGTAHTSPLFDSREYEIELEDGTEDRIFANKNAENIYAQLDDEGR